MPPRCKFTRQEVAEAALEITREHGIAAVTARALGEKLGSSSRPIFSLFQSMQEVQQEVINSASALYQEYLRQDMQSGKYPPYKASGMGYIRFAKEEPELFKLLFMRDRSTDKIDEGEEVKELIKIIMKNTGLSEQNARMFHLEMWVFVHGIATMIATSYLNWDWDTVSDVLTDCYTGLKERFIKGKGA
ncbi:MAG: TetR/AcrR family transcriptional regulator [Eubacterium sp.]|nr:TetR/AcrR family transcriptional regulator [Eubacterium sp.]